MPANTPPSDPTASSAATGPAPAARKAPGSNAPALNPAGPVPVASLSRRRVHDFALTLDAPGRAALAAELGARSLRKLAFGGRLEPVGRADWRLEGVLGATVVQDCVVTGAPVTTRIDQPVLRRFVVAAETPVQPEMEIPDDDTTEPLGRRIDLHAVLAEALSLALPDYPRAPDPAPDPEVAAVLVYSTESPPDIRPDAADTPRTTSDRTKGGRATGSPPPSPAADDTGRPNPFAVLAQLRTTGATDPDREG